VTKETVPVKRIEMMLTQNWTGSEEGDSCVSEVRREPIKTGISSRGCITLEWEGQQGCAWANGRRRGELTSLPT
jgi:hypothetical protein